MALKLPLAATTLLASLLVSSAALAAPSLAGGRITIADLAGGLRVTGTTDAAGARMSQMLPPGAYKLTVVLDATDPAILAQAADVYVEIDVNGRQVSCTRANLSTGAPYSTALLVEGTADAPVVVHLVPRPAATPPVAPVVPPRRGIND